MVLLKYYYFFCFLSSISHIAYSKGKEKGIGESICAMVLVLLIAGLVMPTLGLAHSTQYKRQANRTALEFIDKLSSTESSKDRTKTISLSDYEIEINDDYSDSSDEPKIIEVVYTLKEESEILSYPQQFSVLLNFDTGEKTIKEDTVSEE